MGRIVGPLTDRAAYKGGRDAGDRNGKVTNVEDDSKEPSKTKVIRKDLQNKSLRDDDQTTKETATTAQYIYKAETQAVTEPWL